MSFTIQDMMLISEERYRMRFLAGKNGWSNSISWVHMLEETTIIENFWGKELAVTTGLGFQTGEKLEVLVEKLVKHHAAGLIINVGFYIHEIPEEILFYCEENDLPLLTVPWEIHLSDMIKDFSIRIFVQGSADEQVTMALIAAIETPDNPERYRQELLPYFDVDGQFQVMLIASEGLCEMDSVERKKLSYRLQVYLEHITHNGSFFYYNSYFVLIANAVPQDFFIELGEGLINRANRRMKEIPIFVGVGTPVNDISSLSVSYRRAKAAAHMALRTKTPFLMFSRMGIYRLLYSCADESLLVEMEKEKLEKLEAYDQKHHANYVETLRCYLENDGSIQAMARAMYTHRNTIVYRVNNIKKILESDLSTVEERLTYQIAYYIKDMR